MMFAALYLPDFALQAVLRHAPEWWRQPVATLESEEARAIIFQLTPSAAAAGVRAGMTPSQGLARCLSLTIKGRSAAQEKIVGEILLEQAASLAPEIEATAPGVCTVHFRSEKNCRENVERVVRQLAQLQLTAQAGLAATPDLSFLAAFLARPVLQILPGIKGRVRLEEGLVARPENDGYREWHSLEIAALAFCEKLMSGR